MTSAGGGGFARHDSNSDSDYAAVSETPGDLVLRSALHMAQTRYAFANQQAVGRTIVEIACGSGHGLGLLTRRGRRAVGIDITHQLLLQAHNHYGDRVALVRGDGLLLPLRTGTTDTIVIFEAIYYLRNIAAFLRECHRVLRPQGRLLVCWANPEHVEFNAGAYTVTYPTAAMMRELLEGNRFTSTMYGGFSAQETGALGRARSLIRQTAGRIGLIPAGMRGKAFLKRTFYGGLIKFPAELTGDAAAAPTGLDPLISISKYRVLYAVANRLDRDR